MTDFTQPYSEKELAERLNCSQHTLGRWRRLKIGPRWYRLAGHVKGHVYYDRSEVEKYLRGQE